jgi:nicotinamidase-related amidase
MPPKKRRRPERLLVCLDVQPVFLPIMAGGHGVVARCRFAVAVARGLGIPVLFTEQVPRKLGGTEPSILREAPDAPVCGKLAFSALADDGIRDRIREAGPTELLICGIETPVCVYQTASDALAAGYGVTVLCDAIDARRPEDGRAALEDLARLGARILPSETVFYAILRGADHPFFRDYTALVKKMA